jgi:long-chain fatty acid transport protein
MLAGGQALASGYQVGLDSVSGAGTAYAGGAAAATDASTLLSNPAGAGRA